jgi:hypothetical protein
MLTLEHDAALSITVLPQLPNIFEDTIIPRPQGNVDGAGGGIRTHEGLRHRIPQQALILSPAR